MCEGGCQDNCDYHQQTDNDEWQPGLEKTTPTKEGREGGGGMNRLKQRDSKSVKTEECTLLVIRES